MPDGAVWTAGSNMNGDPSGPTQDTREKRLEVYRPWYFDRDRPGILGAPGRIRYAGGPDSVFPVLVADDRAERISRVVIIRTSSTTHAFSSDQRLVELPFEVADPGQLLVTPPPNGAIAPPGYYLIFILDDAGVPSTATFAQLPAA